MADIKIFTEGPGDVKFIKDYIRELYEIDLPDKSFDILNSWSGYKRGGGIYPLITESYNEGKQIVLILDADNDFLKRQTEVLGDFQEYNVPIHLFLFPNNISTGNIENLLTEIASERVLIDCFSKYEECVKDYNLPLDKSRIYSYLDALLPKEDKIAKKNDLRVESFRNFRKPEHWNLYHEYLQPFHDFLAPFFTETK